jgi:hypothetical protein
MLRCTQRIGASREDVAAGHALLPGDLSMIRPLVSGCLNRMGWMLFRSSVSWENTRLGSCAA